MIGIMRYRWLQWQYWLTVAILLLLLALLNFRFLSGLEAALILFPFMIGEAAFSMVVIIKICPVPEEYKEFSDEK